MATLTDKQVKETYGDLLKIENSNAGITGTTTVDYHQVEDGLGEKSPLRLSTEGVQWGGTDEDGGFGFHNFTLTNSVTGANTVELFLDGVSKTLVIPAGYQFVYDAFLFVVRTDAPGAGGSAAQSHYRAMLRGGSCVHIDGQLILSTAPSFVDGEGSASIAAPVFSAGGSGDSTYLKIEVTGTASQAKKVALFVRGSLIPFIDDVSTMYKYTDTFQPGDIAATDYFGQHVTMSGDGNYVAIGAPLEDEAGSNAGAVYIFKDTTGNGTWTEMQKLTVSGSLYLSNYYWDATWDYEMNRGLALDEDGDTLVIGNRRDNGVRGAVHVFTRTGETWTEEQKITSSVQETNSIFGHSVDISSDGDVIVVGHPWANDGLQDEGRAYIFRRNAGTWTEEQKLVASDAAQDDYFGWDVGINGAGTEVVISSLSDDDTQAHAGAVYTFTESSNTWTQQQKLQSSNAASQDNFGFSIAYAKNDDTFVVTTGFFDSNIPSDCVFVFKKDGTWSEEAVLSPNEGGALSQHYSVAISSDGNTVVNGAPLEDSYGTNQGAAWIYTRSGSTWTQKQKIRANPIAGQTQMWFNTCAISGDASKIVVAAPFADSNFSNAGEAYAWKRADT